MGSIDQLRQDLQRLRSTAPDVDSDPARMSPEPLKTWCEQVAGLTQRMLYQEGIKEEAKLKMNWIYNALQPRKKGRGIYDQLDVFPHDGLGVRIAIRHQYELEDLPDKDTSIEIAAPWRPYATVACWYCWRSLDLARGRKGKPFAANYPT